MPPGPFLCFYSKKKFSHLCRILLLGVYPPMRQWLGTAESSFMIGSGREDSSQAVSLQSQLLALISSVPHGSHSLQIRLIGWSEILTPIHNIISLVGNNSVPRCSKIGTDGCWGNMWTQRPHLLLPFGWRKQNDVMCGVDSWRTKM